MAPRGDRNPNWKGTDAHENTARERARRLYPLDACEDCGAPAIDRHHRDGNVYNNEPANIAALCRRCHMLADGRLASFISNAPRGRPPRTHCRQGHEYTPDTTYFQPNGYKICRICHRQSENKWRRKRRAAT